MRKVDPEKHAARRQAILAAARACFVRRGFHGTSTADICALAGMSPGNLFHYFADKRAMIVAIVEQETGETASYFDALMQRADLYAALLAFMDEVLALAADPDYSALALEISAEAMRDPEVAARVSHNDAVLREALRTLLVEAAARGQMDATLDMRATARWLVALIDGVFNRVAVEPGFAPKRQRKSLHQLLARLLKPATGAPL